MLEVDGKQKLGFDLNTIFMSFQNIMSVRCPRESESNFFLMLNWHVEPAENVLNIVVPFNIILLKIKIWIKNPVGNAPNLSNIKKKGKK